MSGKTLLISEKNNIRNSSQIQCELFRILKNDGYDCHVELRYDNCRFDLVVAYNDVIFVIVECKDTKRTCINKKTRQYIRYSNFNAKLIYCLNEEKISSVIKLIKVLQSNFIKHLG